MLQVSKDTFVVGFAFLDTIGLRFKIICISVASAKKELLAVAILGVNVPPDEGPFADANLKGKFAGVTLPLLVKVQAAVDQLVQSLDVNLSIGCWLLFIEANDTETSMECLKDNHHES